METLDPNGSGGPNSADLWEFTTSTAGTTITINYRNSADDGGGMSFGYVLIEVFDQGSGCTTSLGVYQNNVDCDYPALGGPGTMDCPLPSITLGAAGTYCFKVTPIVSLAGIHCYWLEVTGDNPITNLTLIRDDIP